ncbi:Gfo/Idh/MocA family oxidoreductase [Ramlibacter sp. H39-3-26]|uniref:Gfo/Idh/MocA family protein n=1 Tax=Curvibacter soli TaxID=3031331 RepID=UPI0023DBAE1A|nr:Gfo/Idh/MocA family oxidoreductase [Ramlibacter sp. H39-3-26]MDF1485782.1 Gfo/Idh/MocA family oxidoreductase [Ramlibacter sp. H39-3-26]
MTADIHRPRPPLRLGFVGGALNSAVGYAHFVSSTLDNRFEVVAGCFSRHPDVNAEAGAAYAVAPERVHADWHTLLERERDSLDALVVLTPTPAHAPILATALDAGVPVICEKALATSHAQALHIQESVQRNGGFLAVTYNYTGYPMVRELRQLIRDGLLGQLQQIHVEMPQEGFLRTTDGELPHPQIWRLHDGTIPTVSLDLGVHAHHLVEFLSGQHVLEVVADQRCFGHFPTIIDDISCMARYSGGIRVNYWYGKTALGYRNGLRIRIFGSKASAQWLQAEPELLSIYHADGRREQVDRGSSGLRVASRPRYNRFKPGHPAGFVEAFANLYADIADLLQQRRQGQAHPQSEYVFGANSASAGLAFLEAVTASMHSHAWQPVAGQPPAQEQ